MTASDEDRSYMARALELAARGLNTATPNPRVGCVIAKTGRTLGEGFHARAGEAHAEVAALADTRAHGCDVRGATLYVTLTPCNSFGRTPPCVDLIIDAGVARVVAAMHDPVSVQAGGVARLRDAGIRVDV
ncbi:MAG: bifunctional diaminohydroxyphosphoribosylaminopyrimidine deaminase/5-amino-6-(5-phosphoribosylamino)uracil reductase RibD, partial [Casimicrobiaceae bacterium]